MKLIERNVIEIAPLAYMRGRTLNDAFVILDEAQNTTIEQMKMFLTRIGFGSVAVVTGDMTQTDLPQHVKSGLRDAIEVLRERRRHQLHVLHGQATSCAIRWCSASCAPTRSARRPRRLAMKAERPATRRRRADAAADAAPKLCLWLKNEAGRKGVPMLRSFEKWVGAIPDLREAHAWTELNIVVVDGRAGRRYNRQFRGTDYATNVLSFPYDPAPGEHSGLLGDLVICAPVVAREAARPGQGGARSLRAPDRPRRSASARLRPRDRRRRRAHGGSGAPGAGHARHRRSVC